MSLRRLSRNAFSSSATIIVSALLIFELYRFLARSIGIDQIGVWSIVLASAGVVRLAEIGMTGSVVKFVASYLGAGDKQRAGNAVLVAVSVVAITVGIAALALQPLVQWLIIRTVQDEALTSIALALLPWALAAAWAVSLVTVLTAALDGSQRTDLRALSMVTGNALQLALVHAFVPVYGLAALGPIQLSFILVQALLLTGCLLKVARAGRWGWPRWDAGALRQLLRYGTAFQLTAIGQLLFEPTVRWLLGVFGGLTTAGYYEMANRALVQLRQVIVAAYQMLVPYLAARFGEAGDEKARTRAYYEKTMHVMMITAIPYFAMVGAGLPFLLTFWAGTYSDQFMLIGFISLLGRFVNTLAVPAFMLYLSIGRLRWVAVNELSIGGLNVVFGLLGGYWFGGTGVVVGAMLALACGTMVVVIAFHREYRVVLAHCLPRWLPALAVVALTGLVGMLAYAVQWQGLGLPGPVAMIGFVAMGAVLLAIMWQDPLRRTLIQRISPSTGSVES